jgi:hypothetical protein
VLERVGGLRGDAPLCDDLRCDQLPEGILERRGLQRRHGLQQVIRKGLPDRGPQLCDAFCGREAIEPGHQRIVQRGGNRQGGQRAVQGIVVLVFLQQA